MWSCQCMLSLIQGERQRIKDRDKDRGAKWGWGGCVPWWQWVLSLVSGALVLSIHHTSWINQCIPFMMIWVRVGFLSMKSGTLTDSYGRGGSRVRGRLDWERDCPGPQSFLYLLAASAWDLRCGKGDEFMVEICNRPLTRMAHLSPCAWPIVRS